MRAEEAELAVFFDRLAVVVDGILLAQGVAHAHDDAALDLPLARPGVDGLANVVRGDHVLDLAGLLIEDAHLRRVAVGHVRDGVRHVRAELVGLGEVFTVELLPDEVGQRMALERGGELSQARRQASPVTSVWREPEVSPESGAIQVFERS